MTKLFLHFHQDGVRFPDEFGCEFADVEEAYLSVFRTAQDMWRELLIERRDPRLCAFEATNESGELMFVIPFGEVLDVCTVRNQPASNDQPASGALAETFRRALLVNRKMRDELEYAHSQLTESLAILEAQRHRE